MGQEINLAFSQALGRDLRRSADIAEINTVIVVSRLAGQAPPMLLAVAIDLDDDVVEHGPFPDVMLDFENSWFVLFAERAQKRAEIPAEQIRVCVPRRCSKTIADPVDAAHRVEMPYPVARRGAEFLQQDADDLALFVQFCLVGQVSVEEFGQRSTVERCRAAERQDAGCCTGQ